MVRQISPVWASMSAAMVPSGRMPTIPAVCSVRVPSLSIPNS